ncbi:competence type IV pilus minor pilin ComGG [Bacillus sp. S/N-304-OC-R1]|uniref:competence type IV pilus minor pilin ComGG n=1 Tax=Bacillus sp. S/N-304-OC-R1 TaxID=2758034 RepID=UPI001C8ED6FE|nr:competence type IV pilus minor pilin ComGG [Bacillus sp. S/N-304-OC-R1]MBY0122409.1 hypothetical protein [Bacillus sp. S/N-304-OC-R1]
MIKNEKGFTYPLTFSIILIFALLITMRIEFYLLEFRFYKESETNLKQEFYFYSSVKQMETILSEEDEVYSGVFIFNDGEVSYQTTKLTETLFMTTFSLRMESSGEILGYGYFDREEGKMIKWLERN